jgi:hypothetical protein
LGNSNAARAAVNEEFWNGIVKRRCFLRRFLLGKIISKRINPAVLKKHVPAAPGIF